MAEVVAIIASINENFPTALRSDDGLELDVARILIDEL